MSPFKLFQTFFKLGWFAFGGPAAHIGLFEDKFVEKEKLIDRSYFLDMIGATNLIPGPNSTEMTMHIGHHLGGRKGMFAAGAGFIIPAVLTTLAIAWFYMEYRTVPEAGPFLWGIQAAVLAIIANAVFKLGKKALKGPETYAVGLAALVAALYGQPEVLIILFAGLMMAILRYVQQQGGAKAWLLLVVPQQVAEYATAVDPVKTGTVWEMGWVFLKTGAVLFGSGYVLVAYLETDLVEKLQWMTQTELLDAIALGQMTPGPVLSASTFVGYQLHGFQGAAIATLGIFLPSFIFVMLSHPIIPRLRKSKVASAFLDGANAAAMGVMAAVLLSLTYQMIMPDTPLKMASLQSLHLPALLLAVGSFLLLKYVPKVSPLWLVPGGALTGYLCNLAGWL